MSTSSNIAAPQAIKIISSKPYSLAEYYRKLCRYGFLIDVLARRELKIKYTRTLLGLGWLFLQPLALVIIYSVFFKSFIKMDTGSIPYPSFVFSGLMLWYLFTGIISKNTFAILESAELINKVSFPRFIILLSKTIPVLLECAALLLVLFALLFFTHQPPGFTSVTVLFYILHAGVFSFALGLLCSIVVVKYRDLAHFIPFALNLGIWLTPVFYPVTIVPAAYQKYLLYLNPMAQAIDGLRGALFFNEGISRASLLSFLCSFIFLLFSFFYFVKFEKKLVENL